MRDDCSLDQSVRNGSGKQWLCFENVFEIKTVGIRDWLDVQYERERGQRWLKNFIPELHLSIWWSWSLNRWIFVIKSSFNLACQFLVQRKNETEWRKPRCIMRYKQKQSMINGVSETEEKEKGTESLFQEMMTDNTLNLGKNLEIQIQKVHKSPKRFNSKGPFPAYIIIKLSKMKDKEKNLK